MKTALRRFLFLFCMTAIGGETVFRTYPVRFTDPQEAREIIMLMHPSAETLKIQSADHELAVTGTEEQHRVVRQMLRELDAPPKNVQITVNFSGSETSSGREAGFRQRGPVVIRDGEVEGRIEGRFGSRRSTVEENTSQMLVAMDGRAASLRVGERVPYLTWLIEYGHRHGYVRETGIEWRDVGSFLAVEPTIVGTGLIRVRLIPQLSGRKQNGERETIRFTHLATEVTVADGQTLSIGGFHQDKEFNAHFFPGGSSGGKSMQTGITLTARILD